MKKRVEQNIEEFSFPFHPREVEANLSQSGSDLKGGSQVEDRVVYIIITEELQTMVVAQWVHNMGEQQLEEWDSQVLLLQVV
jgi:hypothetical protein